MMSDSRELAAKYYDLQDNPTEDIPFYSECVASLTFAERMGVSARVLELGCGTGRVLLPVAEVCGFILGVDSSPAMLEICRDKLAQAQIARAKADVALGDITALDVGEQFDLVIAPFRVFQNLATDAEVDGFFDSIRRHLSPGGSAILNAFRPSCVPDEMRARWASPIEELEADISLPDGRRLKI